MTDTKAHDNCQLYIFEVFQKPSEISLVKNEPMYIYGNLINPNYRYYQVRVTKSTLSIYAS